MIRTVLVAILVAALVMIDASAHASNGKTYFAGVDNMIIADGGTAITTDGTDADTKVSVGEMLEIVSTYTGKPVEVVEVVITATKGKVAVFRNFRVIN